MMTSKLSASKCQQMPGTWGDNKGKVTGAAKKLPIQLNPVTLNFSLSLDYFKCMKCTGNSTWVMCLKAARCVYLKGSCHRKLEMARANLWEHRQRHTRPLLVNFITPTYAELFEGHDESLTSTEFLKIPGMDSRNTPDAPRSWATGYSLSLVSLLSNLPLDHHCIR